MAGSEDGETVSLKDQGNAQFKAAQYLKAAATYSKAIKEDPSNATLFRYGFLRALSCRISEILLLGGVQEKCVLYTDVLFSPT